MWFRARVHKCRIRLRFFNRYSGSYCPVFSSKPANQASLNNPVSLNSLSSRVSPNNQVCPSSNQVSPSSQVYLKDFRTSFTTFNLSTGSPCPFLEQDRNTELFTYKFRTHQVHSHK